MITKYDIYIENQAILQRLKRLTNQIYRLLPCREEGLDWEKPLKTIVEELGGMNRLLIGQHEILFPLLCKLEGLFLLREEEDFPLFRSTVFECLSLLSELRSSCR